MIKIIPFSCELDCWTTIITWCTCITVMHKGGEFPLKKTTGFYWIFLLWQKSTSFLDFQKSSGFLDYWIFIPSWYTVSYLPRLCCLQTTHRDQKLTHVVFPLYSVCEFLHQHLFCLPSKLVLTHGAMPTLTKHRQRFFTFEQRGITKTLLTTLVSTS